MQKGFPSVVRSVDENEVIRLLGDLIRCNTVNPPGNEGECSEILADYLKSAGAHVELSEHEKGRANLVARIKGSTGLPALLLNGHLDTVSVGEGWTQDPFGGKVEGGRMYGRGSSDMKSGVAAAAAAMKAILLSEVEPKQDIVFTAVADEESFGPAGTKFLLSKGLAASAAIVTEPTDLQIEIAQRGILWLKIRTEGRAAHGGRPWLGVSAIQAMVDFLNELRILEKKISTKKHPLLLGPSINVGTIEGGTRVNVVPSSCVASIDRRTIPGETVKDAQAEIQEILEKLQQRAVQSSAPPFKASTEVLADLDAFEIPRSHPLVTSLEEAFKIVREKNGKDLVPAEPKIAGKDATSDAGLLYRAGIPTVLFGPGQYKVSHTADECVEIVKVVESSKILAVAALRLAGVD